MRAKGCIRIFVTVLVSGILLGACDFPTATATPHPCMPDQLVMPDLSSPANFAVVFTIPPSLTWTYPGGCVPSGYVVQISTDDTFAIVSQEGNTSHTTLSWSPSITLDPGTEYWWRVAAFYQQGSQKHYGPFSSAWRFYTGPYCATIDLAAPLLVWPDDGEVIDTDMPRLDWENGNAGCVPEGYRIDLSTDPSFADTSLSGGTGNPSSRWFSGDTLMDCVLYHWRVAPINETTLGPFSETRTFSIDLSGICGPGASISGIVWHDLCAVPWGPSGPITPPGCIELSDGGLTANGIYELGEPGIEDITLHLGVGACPSSGLAMASTAPDGSYTFSGLPGGTYCVSVDALNDGNDTILVPGGWTYPVADANPQTTSVTVLDHDAVTDVNFGWDYQFLPAPPTPTPTPPAALMFRVAAIMNANCRTGPASIFDQYGFLLEGDTAVAEGRNAEDTWFWVQLADRSRPCWIAKSLLEFDFDPDLLAIIASPPTPTPAPASVGGWAYLDINANGVRDAGDGSLAGALLTLKSGACPGGSTVATTETSRNGRYDFYNLTAGTYCILTSPLQQTLNPVSQTVELDPGEALDNVNFSKTP